MRIALLTDGIYPYVMGGMQKHSYFLAKYFARNKVHVDLYHFIPEVSENIKNPFSNEELQFLTLINIKIPRNRNFPGHYIYESYLYSRNIYQILIEKNFADFIYVKGFAGWFLLRNKDKLPVKVPIGINFHGYEMFQKWPNIKTGIKLQILKLPVKYNIKKADCLFSYGGKISQILGELDNLAKILEIPTGIGRDWVNHEVLLQSSEKLKFVFVGRSERRKGIVELSKFLTSRIILNWEFHFVGPIPESERILNPNIVYHGTVQDQDKIKKILDGMDILVCPSYSEGMPNVIMEAMARGLAIIATDVGAIGLLVDEENGWLIKGDIVKGLEDSFSQAMNSSSDEILNKKRNSIRKVFDFTWEKIIDKHIQAIEEIIQNKKNKT